MAGMPNAFRYRIFISYAHADIKTASWLHAALENYKIPRKLVGLVTAVGETPRRIGRCFRDEDELGAAHELGPVISEALKSSDALVVVCSPKAAGSKWVNQEIEAFKALGREHRIFALILDGVPHGGHAEECFPPALKLTASGGAAEPLAVDLRKFGRPDALLRIISGLFDIRYDNLKNREERRRRAEQLRLNAVVIFGIALFAVAGVGSWLALQNDARATTAQRTAEVNARNAAQAQTNAEISARSAAQAQATADKSATEANENAAMAAEKQAGIFASEAAKMTDAGRYPAGMLLSLYGDPAAANNPTVHALRPEGFASLRTTLVAAFLHRSSIIIERRAPDTLAILSSDAARAVLASDDAARVIEARTGKVVGELPGPFDGIKRIAFSLDGSRIVTSCYNGAIWIWDGWSLKKVATLQEEFYRSVDQVEFSPDGSRVVTLNNNRLGFWSTKTGASLGQSEYSAAPISNFIFSPDGSRILATNRGVDAQILDGKTGTVVETLSGHLAPIMSASFSADSGRIVTASADATARIWDARTGAIINTLVGHSEPLWSAAFSVDGTRVVTASSDHTARVWDSRSGTSLLTLVGHSGYVKDAQFSPDGLHIVTASADHDARVWDTHSGGNIARLSGHVQSVVSARFLSNGQIVTSSYDETSRIWENPTFHLKSASEQVRQACERLRGMHVYDFAPDERIKQRVLGDKPPYPCGPPPKGEPDWPRDGPKY